MASDNKVILELERESCRLFQAGQFDQLLKFFADDFLLLNPGMELLQGKEHEHAALEAAGQTEGLEMSWQPTDAKVSASGDMAYVYGEIRVKLPGMDEQVEKYVTIWEKRAGEWKLTLQIRNANA